MIVFFFVCERKKRLSNEKKRFKTSMDYYKPPYRGCLG